MSNEVQKQEKQEVTSATAEQLVHSGNAFRPDVDIYGTENEAVFLVDLPGVKKGDVSIEVDETDTLIIRGKNSYAEPAGRVLKQYNVGDFYRAFQLSEDYDKDKIEAALDNGQLRVTIPKREEAKPRKIEIKA